MAARLLAGIGIGAIAALVAATALDRLAQPLTSIDVTNFHLPGVAAWIQTGSIWQIDVFLPDVAPGHYPNNGDVLLLAAVLPWRNDFLAHLAMYPFYALTGLATYVLARQLGAARTAAVLAGCLVLAIPVVAIPALQAGLVDSVMLFGLAGGAALLVRHHLSGATAELVLAGLALGLSFGTKWYGVSSVAIVLAVWAVARLLSGRPLRTVALQAGAVAGLVALAGGVWLLRNSIESGNPVFPVRVAPAGVEIFDAPHDRTREIAGGTIAGYIGDWDVWTGEPDRTILPQLRRALAGPGMLIGAGFLLAVAVVALPRGRIGPLRRRGALAAALAGAAGIALAYSVTPYTAGGPEGLPFLVGADARYLVPALVVAAAAAAAVVGIRLWLLLAFGVLALVAIVDGVRWTTGGAYAAADLDLGAWAGAVVLTVLALWAAPPVWARLRHRRRQLAVGAAAVAALALAAGGYLVQERYNDHRYRGGDPAIDALVERAGDPVRVGLAGVWTDDGVSPVLPAFGPRLANRVVYLGRDDDDMLRRHVNRPEFVAAVRSGDLDLLVIGNGRVEAPEVPERRWALAAGYRPIARSDRLTIYAPPA